jgi:hypothetical protein
LVPSPVNARARVAVPGITIPSSVYPGLTVTNPILLPSLCIFGQDRGTFHYVRMDAYKRDRIRAHLLWPDTGIGCTPDLDWHLANRWEMHPYGLQEEDKLCRFAAFHRAFAASL